MQQNMSYEEPGKIIWSIFPMDTRCHGRNAGPKVFEIVIAEDGWAFAENECQIQNRPKNY
jgi:hypothetical protein